jgi:hypothetical protein
LTSTSLRGLRTVCLLALTVLAVARRAGADEDGRAIGARPQDEKQTCLAASDAGQQLRDDLKYRQARAAFTTCAREVCPLVVRRDCTQWLAEVEGAAPTVVVSARDASGRDLSDVHAELDGQALDGVEGGRPVLVDPGQHAIRFGAQGWAPVEQVLVLRAGEKNRVLDVQFVTPAEPKGSLRRDGVPILTWVFGGAAVVAFGSEAYFGITGLEDRAQDRSLPCAPGCPASDVDSIRTKFITADVCLGIGVAALAAAVVVWATRPRSVPASVNRTSGFDGGEPSGLRVSF